MVIGIDINPIAGNSDHKIRGVGSYITLLKENISKFDKSNEYLYVTDYKKLEKKIDLLHIPYFDPFFLHLPIRKKVKTIITIHDLIPITHKNYFSVGFRGNLKWLVNKNLAKKADAIIVDSDSSGREVSRLLKYPKNKIFTVYLSCDKNLVNFSVQRSNSVLKKFNLPEKYFLYVGDVTWNKNLPRLINAIKKIKIPLILVGKNLAENNFDTENSWNKDRLIVSRETQDKSLFVKLGFVSTVELSALYSSAIALCMPSIDEGFGLPVLEAMKCKCPVIASNAGSLPEVAGEASRYVDPFNIEDIELALRQLSSNLDFRKELIVKGIEQSNKFTIEKMMNNTISVYNSL